MSDLQSIIFCATLRSGSTYLCRMVGNKYEIGNPKEWFERLNIEERLREYGLSPDVGLEEYARRVVEGEKSTNGIFSLKIMFATFSQVMPKLAGADEQGKGLSKAELFRRFFPRPKFVFITRREKVRQAISYSRALQTMVWEIRPEDRRSAAPLLNFDFLEINRVVEMFNHQEEKWNEIFHELECAPFVAVYEEMVENPGRVLADIGQYLGLKPRERSGEHQPLPMVMSDRTNDEWEEQYGKIRRRMESRASGKEGLALPKAAFRVELRPGRQETRGMAGSRVLFPVMVRNASELTWDPIGSSDGKYWIRLGARWTCRETPGFLLDNPGSHLIDPVRPGEGVAIEMALDIPEKPGIYDLTIDLAQDEVAWFGDEGNDPLRLTFEVVPDRQKSAAESYFRESVRLEAGWKWLECFGYYFDAEFPWIYHQEFGWLYCDGKGAESDDYCFWRNSDSAWLWFQYGTAPPRLFYNYTTASWEQY